MNELTLQDLLKEAAKQVEAMTPAKREEMRKAQAASFVRAMSTGCEHGVLDFEQCPDCRPCNDGE